MVENESPCSGTRHESVCTLPILESLSAWRLDDNLSSYTPLSAQCCFVQSISGAIWVDCHEKGHPPSTANSDMVPKFLKKSRLLEGEACKQAKISQGPACNTASAALSALPYTVAANACIV